MRGFLRGDKFRGYADRDTKPLPGAQGPPGRNASPLKRNKVIQGLFLRPDDSAAGIPARTQPQAGAGHRRHPRVKLVEPGSLAREEETSPLVIDRRKGGASNIF